MNIYCDLLPAKVRAVKPQQQSTTVTSPPYKKEAGAGERFGLGKGLVTIGDNEITNMTPIADSIFGTKPATTSRAMGRLIDLFGKLNVVPNSNRFRG